MKILYITNHLNILRQSEGFLNDYLNDLLFYGLTEIKEIEVVDSTPIIHLYKENQNKIPIQYLWGKGFTSTFLIDNDEVDRTNIILQVTGQVTTTINWAGHMKYIQYNSNA